MIPKEIYTLGAVRFNTQPLAQLQGQLLAKREAKRAAEDDAINKYLTDQAGKLTPTGVRAIDLPGFEKRRKDWMQFSILNKDKIKKDPLTRMEADRLYNDALAWQQQSKDATGERTPAIDLIRNPNTRNQLNFERVAGDITLHDLALDDPNRKKIDYNASWYKAPSFDFNKEFKAAAEGQQKAFLRKIPGTFDAQLRTVQTEEGFLPESIKQIARNFARGVIEDPNKFDYYERKSNSASADELVRLNAILKPYFPKLEVALDQPEALAMAEAIERAQSIKDVVARSRPSDTNINIDREGKKGFVDYYGEIEGKLKTPVTIGKPGLPESQRIQGFPVNKLSAITQDRIIDIAKKLTGEDYAQGNLLIQRNPKDNLIYLSFVDKDETTGVPISVTQLVPLTKQDINLEPQVGVQEKRDAASEAEFPTPKVKKPKTYSIGGKEFTLSQIQAGAKKNKMTVAEYLSSFGLKE